MYKNALLYLTSLAIASLLSFYIIRFVYVETLKSDCGKEVDFYLYKNAFNEFIKIQTLADHERLGRDEFPPVLKNSGATSVYRNGRFIYFVLESTSFLADDATSEFFYCLEDPYWAIRDVLRTTKADTYHIQRIPSSGGWYYWMHS